MKSDTCFLLKKLEQRETEFDPTEKLDIMKLPFKEALRKVMDGEITDSLTMAGILKAARILNY